MRKISFLLLSIFLLFSSPFSVLEAQVSQEDPLREILRSVGLIEERLKKIEANQQEILNREEMIIQKVDNLRAWIRKS